MQPNIEEVTTLFTNFHSREPSEEERETLERKLRYGLVLEPNWERLARPTMLGPSWLGIVWLVLEAGPTGEHPGVAAVLEWMRGAHRPQHGRPVEQRWRGLAKALDALVTTERQPRAALVHALRIVDEEGSCYQCDMPVGPGLVGWYTGNEEGPLCPLCLRENAPSLAMLANAAVYGLPQVLRTTRSPLAALVAISTCVDEAPGTQAQRDAPGQASEETA